jgi:hypothetical protein
MLTNATFRTAVLEKVTDPIVRAFWLEEFAGFTDTYTREATPAIQNKIGQFTANPLIRNIVGQATSSFDLREIMDKKKIFIVNLSKGRMGETNASLLGSMLTVKIYLAAMSRADEPAARVQMLPRHYFYVDEFQSMMNEAFADILSESRKYKLALTLANQYIEQMEENVRDAVFGNVGTLICFRVGPFDAEVLKTVFEPTFTAEDLIGLGIGGVYLTLMIDGVGSPPFSAETIPPIEAPNITYRDDVITRSRERYGRRRSDIEMQIKKRQEEFPMPEKKKKERSNFTPASGGGAYSGAFPARRESERGADGFRPRPEALRTAQEAVRSQKRNEADERNSLKAAIEKARAEGIASAPSRSPADIMREKKGSRPQAPRREQPQQTHAQPREQTAAASKPAPKAHEPHAHDGEVSPHVLQQVINGRHRDADDF